jgi:hypothetical protein
MAYEVYPNLIGGNPGQAFPQAYWSALWMLSVPPVPSSSNGIDGVSAQAFMNEKIVEETACYNPLDNGIV